LGAAPLTATNPFTSATIIKVFTGPPLGDPATTEEIPIVKDFTGLTGVADASSSLADIEESGYRLRRIVGKLFFSMAQSVAVQPGDVSTILVTAGFIIRRSEPARPTSLASLTVGGTGINVTSLQNQDDPWIWRRSWMLSNKVDPANTDNFAFAFNGSYGSALDGPHVDQKTARIVGPDERLYLSVTCEGIDGNAQTTPSAILMVGNLRVLASMRSNVGNRRNASR